jgi:ABC-type transport system substrate-binding protein
MRREVGCGRMSRRDFIQLAMAAGVAATTADAMFSQAKADTPAKGGDLHLGISWGSTSNTLDPGPILDSYMGTVNLTIRSLLAEVDEKGNIGTDLAESFEPSNGTKTWAVKLRKGVTFHNGKDLTANDVVASVRHHMGPGRNRHRPAPAGSRRKADGEYDLQPEAATPISPISSASIACRSCPPKTMATSTGSRASAQAPTCSRSSSQAK